MAIRTGDWREIRNVPKKERPETGAAAVDMICGVAMLAFLAGFPLMILVIGTGR